MARTFLFSPALLSGSLAAQIAAALRPQPIRAVGENHPVVTHYMAQAHADGVTAIRNEVLDHIDLDLDRLDLALTRISLAISKVSAARELVLANDFEAASRAMSEITPGLMMTVAEIAKITPTEPAPEAANVPEAPDAEKIQAETIAAVEEAFKEPPMMGTMRPPRVPCQCPDCADLDGNEDDLAAGIPVFIYVR